MTGGTLGVAREDYLGPQPVNLTDNHVPAGVLGLSGGLAGLAAAGMAKNSKKCVSVQVAVWAGRADRSTY